MRRPESGQFIWPVTKKDASQPDMPKIALKTYTQLGKTRRRLRMVASNNRVNARVATAIAFVNNKKLPGAM